MVNSPHEPWPVWHRIVAQIALEDRSGTLVAPASRIDAILRPSAPTTKRVQTPFRASVTAHRAWLKAELAGLDGQIAMALETQPEGSERAAILASVPGVGPVATRMPWKGS